MTVRTDRSTSRAAEVSIRNSDSGVVIKMSGGRATIARRSPAEVSPDRTPTVTLGGRLTQPQSGLGDAGQRRPQVAFDVDRQRLQRRDVQHPAALLGAPAPETG